MPEPVSLNWVGGEDYFALNMGEYNALDELHEVGPEFLFNSLRIEGANWKAGWVYDTIRLGLIGAGMDRKEADKKVRNAFETYGILEFKLPASAILASMLRPRVENPNVEKTEAETQEDVGTSPKSTEQGKSSG